MTALVDWRQAIGPAHGREALAWTLAASAVALTLAATAALAMRLEDSLGLEVPSEEVMFLELAPEPPQSSMAAMPQFAPEAPMTDAPEELAPEEMAEPAPPLAPPPDIRPPSEVAQLPDLAQPLPDSFTPPPPPPPPEAEPEPVVEIPPDVRPEPRPEKPVQREKPKAKKPPAPPQQQASTASNAQGKAQVAVPQGRLNDLKAQWGAKIRAKVQRRNVYPRAAGGAEGSVLMRLVVSRTGALQSVGVARSSGHPVLDEAALRAVRSAGSFPAAPAQLTEASHVFTLPIEFDR